MSVEHLYPSETDLTKETDRYELLSPEDRKKLADKLARELFFPVPPA